MRTEYERNELGCELEGEEICCAFPEGRQLCKEDNMSATVDRKQSSGLGFNKIKPRTIFFSGG